MRASRSKQNRKLPPSSCTYTIQQGDTLGSIAARHLGSSKRWPEIARVNPGTDPNRLRVGARLNLPCANVAGQGGSAPKAKPGEPLAGTGFLARLSGQKAAAAGAAARKGDGKSAIPPSAGQKTGAAGRRNETGSKTLSAAQSNPGKSSTSAKSSAGEKAETAPSAPAEPASPPLPTWTARAGEDFAVVLARWAKTAKYRVVIGTTDAWTLAVPVSIRGDFESAVNQLVKGLGSDGKAPPVRVYSNKVIRLGGL